MNTTPETPKLALVPDFGFAGGGGSSSGGSSSSSSSSSYSSSSYSSGSSGSGSPIADLAIFFFIIAFIVIAAVSSKNQQSKKLKENNSTPEEKFIHTEAEKIFKAYQDDWSNNNAKNIAAYTTPDYHEHASYMIELLENLHRKNRVSNLKINYIYLKSPVNETTPLPAALEIEYNFNGLDEVIDEKSGKTLYKNSAVNVTETWRYLYDGKTLKLKSISQPTESAPHLIKSLADFADQNRLYYSPDWGRYALPERGLIFNKSSMRVSDINNHIIGKWGNLLVQLYTYAAQPGNPSTYYLVGQINVPKDYLGVIVKSKKYKTREKPDKSYDKFEMEWPDFNKRYEVYAASRDALPAFELLNPKFMEYLYDKNLNYNLEVADNVIYIFASVKNITESDYAELLDVLKLAYKELKM